MPFRVSSHAQDELQRRGIPREHLDGVLAHPQQSAAAHGGVAALCGGGGKKAPGRSHADATRPTVVRARKGGAEGGQNRVFRRLARLGFGIRMCFGVPGPQGGRRCAGDDDVSPGNGQSSANGGRTNRVADSAGNMGMATAAGRRWRERWASKTQPSLHFAQPTLCSGGGMPDLAGVSDAGAVVGATGVIRRARQVTPAGSIAAC